MNRMSNSTFKNTGFHHIALKVRDFDKSVGLYQDTLGLNMALSWGEEKERACMLDMGDGTYIEIFDGGQSNGALQQEPMIHFAFLTDECDAMYNAALKAGCSSHMAPEDLTINGHEKDVPIRIAFVIGYDGELIEFFQYR